MIFYLLLDSTEFEVDITHSIFPGTIWSPSRVPLYPVEWADEVDASQTTTLSQGPRPVVQLYGSLESLTVAEQAYHNSTSVNVPLRDSLPSPYLRTDDEVRNFTSPWSVPLTSETLGLREAVVSQTSNFSWWPLNPNAVYLSAIWRGFLNTTRDLDGMMNTVRSLVTTEVRSSLEHMRLKSLQFPEFAFGKPNQATASYHEPSICHGTWYLTSSARDHLDPQSVRQYLQQHSNDTSSSVTSPTPWTSFALTVAKLGLDTTTFQTDVFAETCSKLFPISFPRPGNEFLTDKARCQRDAASRHAATNTTGRTQTQSSARSRRKTSQELFADTIAASPPRFLSTELFVPSLQTLRHPALVPLSPVYADWLDFVDKVVFESADSSVRSTQSTHHLQEEVNGGEAEWAEWIVEANFTRLSGGVRTTAELPQWPQSNGKWPNDDSKPLSFQTKLERGVREPLAQHAAPFSIPLSNAAFGASYETRRLFIKACADFSRFRDASGPSKGSFLVHKKNRHTAQVQLVGNNLRRSALCQALPQLLARTRPRTSVIPSPNPDEWVGQYAKCAAHWEREQYDAKLLALLPLSNETHTSVTPENIVPTKPTTLRAQSQPILKHAPYSRFMNSMSDIMTTIEVSLFRLAKFVLAFCRDPLYYFGQLSNPSQHLTTANNQTTSTISPYQRITKLNAQRAIQESAATLHQLTRAALQASSVRVEMRLLARANSDQMVNAYPYLDLVRRTPQGTGSLSEFELQLVTPEPSAVPAHTALRIIARPSETMFRGHSNLTVVDPHVFAIPLADYKPGENPTVAFDDGSFIPVGLHGIATAIRAIEFEHKMHRGPTESVTDTSPLGAGRSSFVSQIWQQGAFTSNVCQALFGRDASPLLVARTVLAPFSWLGFDIDDFIRSLRRPDQSRDNIGDSTHIKAYEARDRMKARFVEEATSATQDVEEAAYLLDPDGKVPSRLSLPRLSVDPHDWSLSTTEILFPGEVLLETITHTTGASAGGAGDGDEWLAAVYTAPQGRMMLRIIRLFPEGHPLYASPLSLDLVLDNILPKHDNSSAAPVILAIAATPTCYPGPRDPCEELYSHQVVMMLGARADILSASDHPTADSNEVFPGAQIPQEGDPPSTPFFLPFRLSVSAPSGIQPDSNGIHVDYQIEVRLPPGFDPQTGIEDPLSTELRRDADSLYSSIREKLLMGKGKLSNAKLKELRSRYLWYSSTWLRGYNHLVHALKRRPLPHFSHEVAKPSDNSQPAVDPTALAARATVQRTLLDSLFSAKSPSSAHIFTALDELKRRTPDFAKFVNTVGSGPPSTVPILPKPQRQRSPRKLARVAIPIASMLPPPVYLNTYAIPFGNSPQFANRSKWTLLGSDVSHSLPPLSLQTVSPAAFVASPTLGGMRSDKLAVLSIGITLPNTTTSPPQAKPKPQSQVQTGQRQHFDVLERIPFIVQYGIAFTFGITLDELRDVLEFFSGETTPGRRPQIEEADDAGHEDPAPGDHEPTPAYTTIAYTLDTWTLSDLSRGCVAPPAIPPKLRNYGSMLRKDEVVIDDSPSFAGAKGLSLESDPTWQLLKQTAEDIKVRSVNMTLTSLVERQSKLLSRVAAYALQLQHGGSTNSIALESDQFLEKPRVVLADGGRLRPLRTVYSHPEFAKREDVLLRHTVLKPLILESAGHNSSVNTTQLGVTISVFHTLSTRPPVELANKTSASHWSWMPYEQLSQSRDIQLKNSAYNSPHLLTTYLRHRRRSRPSLVTSSPDGRITIIAENPTLITIDAGAFYGIITLIRHREPDSSGHETDHNAVDGPSDIISKNFFSSDEMELEFKSMAVNARGNLLILTLSDNKFVVMGRRFVTRFEDRTMARPVRSHWQRARLEAVRKILRKINDQFNKLHQAELRAAQLRTKFGNRSDEYKSEMHTVEKYRRDMQHARWQLEQLRAHYATPLDLQDEFRETSKHFSVPSATSEAIRQARASDPVANPFRELYSFDTRILNELLLLEERSLGGTNGTDKLREFTRRPQWSWFWGLTSAKPTADQVRMRPWSGLLQEALLETRLPRDFDLGSSRSSGWQSLGELEPPPALAGLDVLSISLVDSSALPGTMSVYRCVQIEGSQSSIEIEGEDSKSPKFTCSEPTFESRVSPLLPLSTYLVVVYKNGLVAAYDLPFGDRAPFVKVAQIVEKELPPYVSSRSRTYAETLPSQDANSVPSDSAVSRIWYQRQDFSEWPRLLPAKRVADAFFGNERYSLFPYLTKRVGHHDAVAEYLLGDFPVPRQPHLPYLHPAVPIYPYLVPPPYPLLNLVAQALPSRYALLPHDLLRVPSVHRLVGELSDSSDGVIKPAHPVGDILPVNHTAQLLGALPSASVGAPVAIPSSSSSEPLPKTTNQTRARGEEFAELDDLELPRLWIFDKLWSALTTTRHPFVNLLLTPARIIVNLMEMSVDNVRLAVLEADGSLGDPLMTNTEPEYDSLAKGKATYALTSNQSQDVTRAKPNSSLSKEELSGIAAKIRDNRPLLASETTDFQAANSMGVDLEDVVDIEEDVQLYNHLVAKLGARSHLESRQQGTTSTGHGTRSSKASAASWAVTFINGLILLIVLPFALGLLIARHYGGPRPQVEAPRAGNQQNAHPLLLARQRGNLPNTSMVTLNREVNDPRSRAEVVAQNAAALANSLSPQLRNPSQESVPDDYQAQGSLELDQTLRSRRHRGLDNSPETSAVTAISFTPQTNLIRPGRDLYSADLAGSLAGSEQHEQPQG